MRTGTRKIDAKKHGSNCHSEIIFISIIVWRKYRNKNKNEAYMAGGNKHVYLKEMNNKAMSAYELNENELEQVARYAEYSFPSHVVRLPGHHRRR